MQNNISKSTFIFSLIIVALLTYIITRELSLKQIPQPIAIDSSAGGGAMNALTKAKALTGKDGNEADPYEKEQVKNTIIKNAKILQECYTNWLASKPPVPKANIKIDWTILPNGKVQNPQVIESEAATMNDCLVAKVSGIEFPPPPEGKNFYVAHKFSFNTEENIEKQKREQEKMEKQFNPLKH